MHAHQLQTGVMLVELDPKWDGKKNFGMSLPITGGEAVDARSTFEREFCLAINTHIVYTNLCRFSLWRQSQAVSNVRARTDADIK